MATQRNKERAEFDAKSGEQQAEYTETVWVDSDSERQQVVTTTTARLGRPAKLTV